MKDFKQTPKMNASGSHYCGGGKVKKYAEGGEIIAKVHEAIRSGKDLDPKMTISSGSQGPNRALNRAMGLPENSNPKIVDRMPQGSNDGTMISPIDGKRVKLAPPKLTDTGMLLLKTGGKVKRGNKK